MRKISLIVAVSLMLLALCGCSLINNSGSTQPLESGNTEATADTSLNDDASANQAEPETNPPDNGPVITDPSNPDIGDDSVDADGMFTATITVGTTVFTAKLYDNASARAIIEQMPLSLMMDDYASQEKVTVLPFDLPDASTEQPATINAGDLYLWSGNSLVLFFTTFSNSYSYVPIGYIEDAAGLADVLGSGGVTVMFDIT